MLYIRRRILYVRHPNRVVYVLDVIVGYILGTPIMSWPRSTCSYSKCFLARSKLLFLISCLHVSCRQCTCF
jgi:hypothetical protein